MDITNLTVHELQEKLAKKELTSEEIVQAYINRINAKEKDVKAFVTTLCDEALTQAKEIDKKKKKWRKTIKFSRYSSRNKR